MVSILKKVSSKSIDFYVEQNLDDFYTKCAEHSNFSSHIDEKISWILAKNSEWPDCIFRANLEHLKIGNEIKNIKRLIKKGKAPNGWTIGPLTKPYGLGNLLEENGFSNVYHQAGMALDLEELKYQVSDENKLVVEIVKDTEHLKQWAGVVSSVFSIKIDFELMEYLHVAPEAKFFIGNLDGKHVSSLLLYLSSGVAGLHAVSTLKEYRSRGFGLAISKIALINAFKIGYEVGVLQASTLGERVYRKLGFKKYCDIFSYEIDKRDFISNNL